MQLQKELVEVRQVAEQNATKLDLVKRHTIENKQYSRKTNMRMFGISQVRGENGKTIVTEMLEKKLGKKVPAGDSVCGHTESWGKTMPPNIIVQFASRELKLAL